MQNYLGMPGGCLVRAVDDSTPWRFVMGLETIYVFPPSVDPTGMGLVMAFNRHVASMNANLGARWFSAQTVKQVGQEILHALGLP